MFNRKACKRSAKTSLRKHYVLFVLLCFAASMIGTANSSSYHYLSSVISAVTSPDNSNDTASSDNSMLTNAMTSVLTNPSAGREVVNELVESKADKSSTHIGKHIEIGHLKGVLAGVINEVSSGAFLIAILSALCTVLGSSAAAKAVFIILSFVTVLLFWMFFINLYKVVYARILLEGRLYKNVPMQRLAYLIYVKKWCCAARTMFLKSLCQSLWQLTIVGGIIKHFSYFAVPYITAENPGIGARKAIQLSRRMMNGHKWECFKLSLSFIGWSILNTVTSGLSGILFSDPYKEATYCEYYAHIRKSALDNKLAGTEELPDRYLFEFPSDDVLTLAYGSIDDYRITSQYRPVGIRNKICDFFGIYFSREDEANYTEYMKQKVRFNSVKKILSKEEYGNKFLAVPEKKRKPRAEFLFYSRRYSVWSLIMLFASFSVIGWLWEVTLHLVRDGNFVNRGVLHGPWLPIYGTGGVLILLLLNKLRTKPAAEFFAAIVLCGFIEYFVGLNLELTHGGRKWWNYSGFFFNIDGRVCAEGLLVFALGGMAAVYLAAPLLDNRIRKLPQKTLITACIVFLVVFTSDNIYSNYHPNTGKGITSSSVEDAKSPAGTSRQGFSYSKCILMLITSPLVKTRILGP